METTTSSSRTSRTFSSSKCSHLDVADDIDDGDDAPTGLWTEVEGVELEEDEEGRATETV